MSDVLEPESLASNGPPLVDLFMTVVRVADWPTIVRWYTDTLGLVPVLLDHKHEFAFLAAGQGRLGLQGIKRSSESVARSNVRLVFQVDDLDLQRRRLIEQGVAVSAAINNSDEGYREIRLHDPVGNSLTLFAWLDPVPARQFSGDRGQIK